MASIGNARVLIIATDGVEQAELATRRDRLRGQGVKVDVAAPSGDQIRGCNVTDWGETIPADLKIADANIDDYDALIIRGGVLNLDKLRVDNDAMGVVLAAEPKVPDCGANPPP